MARDILTEYGPESKPGGNRAGCGGVTEAKELPYSPPIGPRNKTTPGTSGTNHGQCGSQGKR
jgi:hypothetical protein